MNAARMGPSAGGMSDAAAEAATRTFAVCWLSRISFQSVDFEVFQRVDTDLYGHKMDDADSDMR